MDDDEQEYQYDDDLDEDDDYTSENRHRRAKEAARILLAQCLLEDNPRYYSDSFSSNKTSRLGLAPVTLLLNPETPCPTKIIPLPDSTSSSGSSSSAYSLDDASSSEEEQEANDVQEAQAASLFIRLL